MVADILFKQLKKINFEEMDLDEVLDKRDYSEFGDEWNRVQQELEDIKKESELTEQDEELLGYKDSWLTKLIECYQNAQFPF